MEESNQKQPYDNGNEQDNQQGNINEMKGNVNGSINNIRVFSKTDIFNHFNTEMSEFHDNDIVSQDLIGRVAKDEQVHISQINQIVKQAIYPYLERIHQLEEIQQQKDCQITALFYTVKKMDEIIKKIETEQLKAGPATKTTASSNRKTTTVVQSNGSGATGTSVRSTSTARASQINSSSLSQSTMVTSSTGSGLQRKPSVPSLLDSRKSNLSKSTLHETASSKPDSTRNSKISTPSSRNKEKETADQPKKIVKAEKSLIGKEAEQKIASSGQINGQKQKPISNQSETQGIINTNTSQSQQEENQKVSNENNNIAPPLFLQDLNDDSHLIDNHSLNNYCSEKSDKEDTHNKNVLNNSNQLNEDSMLL